MIPEETKNLIRTQPAKELVQQILFDGHVPYCFRENQEIYKKFRSDICSEFKIHPQNFTIVGSAKTGFSLNPDPSKGRFGKSFDDTSDIDVVIISDEVFQDLWLQLLEYQKTTVYKLDPDKKKKFAELQRIMFWGLIRFDKLSNEFKFAKKWWEFFNDMSTNNLYGPRRVRAGLFKSWYHASLNYERVFLDIKETI